MKKIITLSILCIVTSISLGYYFFTPSNIIRSSTNHKIYENLDEVTKVSDEIIVASTKKEFEDFTPLVTYEEDNRNIIKNYETIIEVDVHKGIKGKLKKNDKIKISMLAAYLPSITKKNKDLLIGEDVTLLKKNLKYILCLRKVDNIYYIVSLDQGKFNIDDKDIEEKSHANSRAQFKGLKNDALIKFKEHINLID